MILLTGATGFLGKHLLLRFLQWEGQLRVIVRDAARMRAQLPEYARAPGAVDIIEWDLNSKVKARAEWFEGVDRVVHNAAIVKVGSERFSQMHRVNVGATEQLLALAPKQVYFLQIGSVAAYGPTGTEPLDEQPYFPVTSLSPYEATKRGAVEAARKRMGSYLPTGILNPGIIYGPDAHGSLTRYAAKIAQNKLPMFVAGDSLASFVHVDDVVECVVEMLKRRECDEFIASGEVVAFREFLEIIATVTGGTAPQRYLPAKPLEIALTPFALFMKLFGAELPVTPTMLRVASNHWAYHSGKAERLLGIHFRLLEAGVRDWLSKAPL